MSITNFRPIPTITVADDYWENGTWKFYMPEISPESSGEQWIEITLHGLGALTLINSLPDSLTALTLFGGTEQRNLPEGYTQVEYLESSGTQYIDTGINDITNSEFEVVAQQTSITGAFPTIMGALDSDSNYKVICGLSTSNNTFYSQCGGPNGFIVSSVPNDTQKHTFKVTTTTNQQTLQIDDTAVVIGNYAITSTTGYPLTICARNKDTVSNFTNQKVFSVRIKKSGTLVCNLIPARRNSDNVLGMYDTVTGNFLTNAGTGDFVAGSMAVPSPDAPMDIVSNNGVLKYGVIGKNLFNPTKVLFGYYRDRTTGDKTQSTQNFMSSDDGYIPCLPNTTYTFVGTKKTDGTYSKYNTIYFFDSVKNYLGASPYEISQPTTGTTPNNCYYLQVRSNPLDTASVSIQDAFAQFNWQLELGSTATAYEPYQEGIYTDGTTETVEVHGKNLFDEQWNRNTGTSTAAATWGQVVTANSWSTSALIPVKTGQQYTISYNTTVQIYVFYYEADGTMQQSYDATSATKKTFTVPSGATHIRLQVNKSTEAAIAALETQLELGSTATTYEPYFNGGSATAEMLLKVGDYQDVQSVLDGEVTRNIGIKVLDGTEDWATSGTTFITNITDSNPNLSYQKLLYCTHYPALNNSKETFGVNLTVYSSGDYASLYLKGSGFSTSSELNTWLAQQYNAGTPVIVIYPLATATTESVTGQPLTIQAGTNIVEITQASIDNLELEVSYKAGVAVTITEVQNAQLDNSVEVTING